MANVYTADYIIWITDPDQCAAAQAAYPNGVTGMSPNAAATLFSAPVNPAIPTFFDGTCIWSLGIENGNAGLTLAVSSVAIPANFVATSGYDLQAFAGAPAGTLSWVGVILRRVPPGPVTNEALQTHRWMVGWERPQNGEGVFSGTSANRTCREASRTIDGMGLAMRSPANETVVMSLPVTTKVSWERVYVRLKKYPAANTPIWGCLGSVEGGTAGLLFVTPTGQLFLANKGNQAYPGTTGTAATGGQLALNTWVKLDLIITFSSGVVAGVGGGSLVLYQNGARVATMAGAGFGAGGIVNQTQNHTSSYVGNEDATANTLEIDYDDWTNKTQPILGTGVDWANGTHIQALNLTGFGAAQTPAAWTGAVQTLDGLPAVPQSDTVTTSVANAVLDVTTDYQDRQVGCSGFSVSVYTETASGTAESVGYSINGAASVLTAITTNNTSWAIPSVLRQALYSAGGNVNPPLLTAVNGRYVRDAVANARAVKALQVSAEYVGVWGLEDVPNGVSATRFPIRQGAHNSPYPDSNFGQNAMSRPDGIVEVMSGTYVGNGTGQDISMQFPAHFIWIRPLTGGSGGSRWWSSMIAGHDPTTESVAKQNLVRCYQSSPNAGAAGYKFRVSGATANSNANGVTYQWVAFSDRSNRFCLNGSYLTLSGTASFSQPLFDGNFTPVAGFLLPELNTVSATTGLYYKGPGHAANAASIMDSAESATVCAFGAGSITPKTILNLQQAQTSYSLWRSTDDSGVSGAVAITSYTGDNNASRNIALALGGLAPRLVIVQPHNALAWSRDPSHSGSTSSQVTSASTGTTSITAIAANQITVGITLNAVGVVYDVFALSGGSANGGPTVLEPPIPPTTPWDPSSLNGWWTSGIRFTGAATISTYPPTNPHDARDWQKINLFATGNAGFHGGFPAPGCVVDNFFIYAGNDYQVNASQPTIRVFDGISDRNVIQIPDVAGVKTIAIMAMLAVGQKIYVTTLDGGTSASTWTGRVFEFDPIALTLNQMGAQFTGGEVPYALCWHMNRLWLGTNKGTGAAAKVYWFRPGQDTTWTQDHALTTDGVGGVMSMASYQGLLYVGCNARAVDGTNKILVRDTTGAYTTSFTATSAGTFRDSNGFPAMCVFNDKLYATYWNPDTVPDCYVKMFDGNTWTTVYTGTGNTVRPFIGLFESQKTLFLLGGGSALAACLLSSPDGAVWTNLTGFLTGSTTTVTALPIVGQIGA